MTNPMHIKEVKFSCDLSLANYLTAGATGPVADEARDELARRRAWATEMRRIDKLEKSTP